jgi:hypothetical protein
VLVAANDLTLRFAVGGLPFAALLLVAACRAAPEESPRHVVLSYEERHAGCANCPQFRIEFRDAGLVTFHGVAHCAVPGVSSYRIPAGEFFALREAFEAADFFGIPRIVPGAFDHGVRITLAYRDNRRVHETVRIGQKDSVLTPLADRMRTAARADALLTPSLAKYQELVRNRWDVNTLGEDHQNGLTATVWGGDEASARFLLARGSAVTDEALDAAVSRDEPTFARLLLGAVDEPRKRRMLGPLLVRAARRSDAVTRDLVAAGADVNWMDPSGGRTPLLAAIESGSLDRAAFLLASGASATIADAAGRTPMHAAAAAYNTGFITMLTKRGAPVDAQDRDGRTALIVVADRCNEWNVPPLLAAGARVDVGDKDGRTALQPRLSVVGDPKCQRTQDLIRQSTRRSDIR